MKFILASQSPRRKELLSRVVSDFNVRVSHVEEVVPASLQPQEVVMHLAKIKAEAVARELRLEQPAQRFAVIGADTVVVLDHQIMGKPKDRADCVRMLSALSGREHAVYTGVAVVVDGRTESFYERTAVRFLQLSDEEINWYASLDEPYDKAGAYGIQGYGSLLVEGICGDYFNVMGLPVASLRRRLLSLGVLSLPKAEKKDC